MEQESYERLAVILRHGVSGRLHLIEEPDGDRLQLWIETDREASTWSLPVKDGASFRRAIEHLYDIALEELIFPHPAVRSGKPGR